MAEMILIVDDEAGVRELLGDALRIAGFETATASDGMSALTAIRNKKPDLLIIDINMPLMDGFELVERLRSTGDNTPALMLSARADRADVTRGLTLGADDYVTKPFSPRELNARIKAVLRRRAPQMTDDPIEIQGLLLDPTTHRVTGNNVNIDLGPTEFRLLHFFMGNAERVHSRSQLLDKVWGDRVFVEDRTVDVHIRRLRRALETYHCESYVQTVRGAGYRFSVQD
jgi:two-component system phosphate regulon response regulator PhoB